MRTKTMRSGVASRISRKHSSLLFDDTQLDCLNQSMFHQFEGKDIGLDDFV